MLNRFVKKKAAMFLNDQTNKSFNKIIELTEKHHTGVKLQDHYV